MATKGTSLTWQRPWLYAKQEQALFNPARYAVCEASTKGGKALPLTSLVYTPRGPKTMGEIAIGDEVLTVDGVSAVDGVFPQGVQDVYRITFSDGTSAECTDDHLWEIHNDKRDYRRGFEGRLAADPSLRRRKDHVGWPRVMPLSELRKYSEKRLRRMSIPVSDTASFERQPVDVDPYLLGILLGDGCLRNTAIGFSTIDQEIVESVRHSMPEGHEVVKAQTGCDYRIRLDSNWQNHPDRLTELLRRLGVYGCLAHEKFIPAAYRYNSRPVRLYVLQGLMDTDGTVDSHGQPWYSSSSRTLAEHVAEIVQSLGGTAKITTKKTTHRDNYVVRITISQGSHLFRLNRKRALCTDKRRPVKRTIRSIELVGRAECQCIKIADPRGLFLTDHLIATHNTLGSMIWLFEQALINGGPNRHFLWGAPYAKQSEIAFGRYVSMLDPQFITPQEAKSRIKVETNGSYIDFRSLDNPDSAYGEDYYAAVMDEFTRTSPDAWKAVRSTLTATGGPVRLIGNVLNRGNWGYRFARMAEQEMRSGNTKYHYAKITAYDAADAGIFPHSEIEEARQGMPEMEWRALYLAEPPDDGGNPFGLNHIEAQSMPEKWRGEGEPICFGWDWAKAQDYTVGIGLSYDGDVVFFDRWQSDWGATERRAISGTKGHPALADSTGIGDAILDHLIEEDPGVWEGYIFSQPSKQKLMEGLAVAIQQGEIHFPSNEIRAELENFIYEFTKTGVRYEAPPGFHDDCVMALALAVHKWHELVRFDLPFGWYSKEQS